MIQNDGRLPRVQSDRAREVRLVVGAGTWRLEAVSIPGGETSAEEDEDEQAETETLDPNDPYAAVIDGDDDDRLSLDVIIPLMQMDLA